MHDRLPSPQLDPLESLHVAAANAIYAHARPFALEELARMTRQLLGALLFAHACEAAGAAPPGQLAACAVHPEGPARVRGHLEALGARVGLELWPAALPTDGITPSALLASVEALVALEPPSPEGFGVGMARLGLLRLEARGPELFGARDTRSRRRQGIYYTPPSLAALIARQALEPALEARAGRGVGFEELVVLDPACGAGAILLAAWRVLEGHLVGRARRGGAQLLEGRRFGPEARARAMRAHLRGIDLDEGALWAAQAALALELARAGDGLPRCAALLGGVFARGDALRGPEELGGCAWARPAGAHVVVGNPPYVLAQSMAHGARFEAWVRQRFTSATYKVETGQLFLERALELVAPGGRLALLTPRSWLTNASAAPLRELLLSGATLERIILLEYAAFPGVCVEPMITVARRAPAAPTHRVETAQARSPRRLEPGPRPLQASWRDQPGAVIRVGGGAAARARLEAIEADTIPLSAIAQAYFGLQTRGRARWVRARAEEQAAGGRWEPPAGWRLCVDGQDVHPMCLGPARQLVCVRPEAIKSGGDARIQERRRILVRQIGRRPIAAIAPGGIWALNTIYHVYLRPEAPPYDLRYVLAMLTSRTLGWYWTQRASDHKRTFPKIKKAPLLALPLPSIDFEAPAERARHDELVGLVSALERLRIQAHREDAGASSRARDTESRLHERIAALYADPGAGV